MASVVFRGLKRRGAEAVNIMEHNLRTKTPKNTDALRAHLNVIEFRIPEWQERVTEARTRKDNAEYVEWVLGSDRETMDGMDAERRRAFREASASWVESVFGVGSLIEVAEHNDEVGAPHLHISALPLKDGKLNAKHFMGGSNARMSQLQTLYVEHMHEAGFRELERGKDKKVTGVDHQTQQEYWDNLEKAHAIIADKNKTVDRILERQILGTKKILGVGITDVEDFDDYQERVAEELKDLNLSVELSKLRGSMSEFEKLKKHAKLLESELLRLAPMEPEAKVAFLKVAELSIVNSGLRTKLGKLEAEVGKLETTNARLHERLLEYEAPALAKLVEVPKVPDNVRNRNQVTIEANFANIERDKIVPNSGGKTREELDAMWAKSNSNKVGGPGR